MTSQRLEDLSGQNHQIVGISLERRISRSAVIRESPSTSAVAPYDAIRRISGIRCWKCHRARTRTAGYWEDDKAGLDFLQEGFKAETEANPASTYEGPHLQA